MICPLAKPHRAGQCHWCGRKLKGRQTRWCSRDCSRTATLNHRWTQARAYKKLEAAYFLCANARWVDTNNDFHGGEPEWRLIKPVNCEGFTKKPEVNHIEPCMNKHGVWGCHHHQSNLEVLCPPCHKKVTAAQAAERAAKRKESK